MKPSRLALPLLSVLAFACAHPLAATPSGDHRDELDRMLQVYDRTADGPPRLELAARIDALAAQRYATWSRLAWHTDLELAKAEARARKLPISHRAAEIQVRAVARREPQRRGRRSKRGDEKRVRRAGDGGRSGVSRIHADLPARARE